MQKVAVCCSELQCVAVCCSVLQCVAVCCSVLQRVAVCCSVLQCVAVCLLPRFVTHMNEPCHTCEWAMSHTRMCHVTHMNVSCHTCECVKSQAWTCHVAHRNKSCHMSYFLKHSDRYVYRERDRIEIRGRTSIRRRILQKKNQKKKKSGQSCNGNSIANFYKKSPSFYLKKPYSQDVCCSAQQDVCCSAHAYSVASYKNWKTIHNKKIKWLQKQEQRLNDSTKKRDKSWLIHVYDSFIFMVHSYVWFIHMKKGTSPFFVLSPEIGLWKANNLSKEHDQNN